MLVGGDIFAEHGDAGIAVAEGLAFGVLEITEHLIVGSVLLDDVEHVLDGAGSADLVRNDAFAPGRSALHGIGLERGVRTHLLRVGGHLLVVWLGDE